MCAPAVKLYRPRNPKASPFFKLVRDHFDKFERVYEERFQRKYGYWRPVMRNAIDKYIKCGDLREGFVRVRCPDCGKEFLWRFRAGNAAVARPAIRSGRCCWVCGLRRRITRLDMEQYTEMWRGRVFDLRVREKKSAENVVRSMRGWPHSGFSINNSVQVGSEAEEVMHRLVFYESCCPFSLARMIKVTEDGQR